MTLFNICLSLLRRAMEDLVFGTGPEDLLRFGESLLAMYRMSNQK